MRYARKRSRNKAVIVLVILVLLCAGLLGTMIWFASTHFFVGSKAYRNDSASLNLRSQFLTISEYEEIRERLPDCEIFWNVPFQNTAYPEDTTGISVRKLSDEDLNVLAYLPELKSIDAVGCTDYAQLEKLREQYPHIELTYTVTIGGRDYPQDAAAVTCDTLTDEEIALMAHLPELKTVDASGCRDYSRIGVLGETFPGLDISYQVELLGQTFTEATVSATFDDPDVNVLMEQLAYVTHMESVHLVEPSASAESLLQLMEAYPDITFTWDKTVLGKTFNSAATEYDLTETNLITNKPNGWGPALDASETSRITADLEKAMRYFPNAEKVIVPQCALDNETMSAFREKMRQDYKVVWTVYVTKKPIRTDATIIHSSALKVCFIDEQSQDLKYCEDAVIVDIGHSYVKDISWVEHMPNLQYLILTHNWVKDLSPLSSCKKLIYLEIYWNEHIQDYTPLQGCTALVDLNLSGTYADIEPLKKLTWVKNLWANCCGLTDAEYRELSEALPDTYIEYRGGDYTSYGWRQVQGYFDMRDMMGLPYNHW